MNNNVLVLNASYEPLNAVTVTRAMNLIVSGKAVTIETDGEIFHSINNLLESSHSAIAQDTGSAQQTLYQGVL